MGKHRIIINRAVLLLHFCLLILISSFLTLHANTYQFSSMGIDNIKFENISIPDGLSQVTVLAINQDYRGFLWIGTREGLNKYDGYDFSYYKQMGEEGKSLLSNYVSAIFSDSKNNLWVGTDKGLNLYLINEDRIKSYADEMSIASGITDAKILVIYEDMLKNIWVGTDRGLFKYISDQDTFEKVKFRHSDKDAPFQVYSILQVTENIFLIGSAMGLMILKDGEFVQNSELEYLGPISLRITGSVQKMILDSKGQIWVGSNSGLYKIDAVRQRLRKFTSEKKYSPIVLQSNYISALLEDQKGNIWIGTDRGLTVLNEKIGQSYTYNMDLDKKNTISDDVITDLFSDQSGVIWIGTEGGGISRFDWGQQKFNGFGYINKNGHGLSDRFIYSICEDQNNDLWLATNKGINRLNMINSRFSYYDTSPGKFGKINHNKVRIVRCDSDGRIWAGGYDGVNIIDPRKNQVISLKNIPGEPNSLSDNKVASLFLESPEKVWIGTMLGGLNLYNPRKRHLRPIAMRLKTLIQFAMMKSEL